MKGKEKIMAGPHIWLLKAWLPKELKPKKKGNDLEKIIYYLRYFLFKFNESRARESLKILRKSVVGSKRMIAEAYRDLEIELSISEKGSDLQRIMTALTIDLSEMTVSSELLDTITCGNLLEKMFQNLDRCYSLSLHFVLEKDLLIKKTEKKSLFRGEDVMWDELRAQLNCAIFLGKLTELETPAKKADYAELIEEDKKELMCLLLDGIIVFGSCNPDMEEKLFERLLPEGRKLHLALTYRNSMTPAELVMLSKKVNLLEMILKKGGELAQEKIIALLDKLDDKMCDF